MAGRAVLPSRPSSSPGVQRRRWATRRSSLSCCSSPTTGRAAADPRATQFKRDGKRHHLPRRRILVARSVTDRHQSEGVEGSLRAVEDEQAPQGESHIAPGGPHPGLPVRDHADRRSARLLDGQGNVPFARRVARPPPRQAARAVHDVEPEETIAYARRERQLLADLRRCRDEGVPFLRGQPHEVSVRFSGDHRLGDAEAERFRGGQFARIVSRQRPHESLDDEPAFGTFRVPRSGVFRASRFHAHPTRLPP